MALQQVREGSAVRGIKLRQDLIRHANVSDRSPEAKGPIAALLRTPRSGQLYKALPTECRISQDCMDVRVRSPHTAPKLVGPGEVQARVQEKVFNRWHQDRHIVH